MFDDSADMLAQARFAMEFCAIESCGKCTPCRIGAVRASSFHFLNPFFGIAIAAVLLGERIRPLDILGVAVAMAGILAVQMARSRPGVAAATPDSSKY